MGFKKKRDYDLYAKKELKERVDDIIKAEREANTFLPKSIDIVDTDIAFIDTYLKGGKFDVTGFNGQLIPIVSAHNPNELSGRKLENYSDVNKSLVLPIVIVKRKETKQSDIKNIVDGKYYTYLSVPSTDNGNANVEHYRITVPIFIKLVYEVTLISNSLYDANKYDELMVKYYNDIHDYMVVKGYYVHIKLTSMSSDDKLGDMSSNDEYKRVYTFEVESRLHNADNYKVSMGMRNIKPKFNVKN